MSTETHEIIFKSNYADLKKAEAEYKIAVSNEIAADKLRVSEAMTTNKVIVEQAKLKNQLLLRDDADMRVKQREMSRAYDQALIEDAKRTQGKLLEDQINKNAADRLRNAANTGFAANQPAPGDITSWKTLNLAIKETRSELVRLTTEGKAGGAEWGRYSDRLRELVRQKQLVQRETRLTSQQLLAMSRDLTVVAYGIRTIATDVISLGDGKKSAGELAMAIGGIGLQTLTVLPAIHGLTKALEAAGIVSATTIARLGALSSSLSVLTAGIAVVTAAYGTMAGSVTHVGDVVDRLGKVLSGQLSYWDAVKENIKDVTFGLLDFTAASDSFDSSNVQQQLSDLAYIANFTANSFADLKQKVSDAVDSNRSKLLEYYTLTKNPLSFAGPDISDQDRLKAFEDYKKGKTKSPGSKGTRQQDQKEELNFLESLRKKVSELQSEIKTLGELEKTQNITEYEKLNILDEKIKKQKELNELMKRGGLGELPSPQNLNNLLLQDLGIRQAGIGKNPRDAQITLEEELSKLEAQRLDYAKSIGSEFVNILQITGLMKTDFGQIIALIQSIIGGVSSGFSFFDSIVGLVSSFIPGAGAITSVIGGASGGGGLAGAAMGGMNANPRMGGMNKSVIVKNYFSGELSAVGSYKVVKMGNNMISERGTGVI